jgi:hypothetical protein
VKKWRKIVEKMLLSASHRRENRASDIWVVGRKRRKNGKVKKGRGKINGQFKVKIFTNGG